MQRAPLINGTAYTDTGAGQDPNLVGIFAEEPLTHNGTIGCSGVVVGSTGSLVLTAGHCVLEQADYKVFKGNENETGGMNASQFSSAHPLHAVEMKDRFPHVITNPSFTWLEGRRKSGQPTDPWATDVAIMYLADSYGSGLSVDCSKIPSFDPPTVRVHSASTQRAMVKGDPNSLYFPFAGQRGTKTYGDFPVITDSSDSKLKIGVKNGVDAGMLVIGTGDKGQMVTTGDSGGPVYSTTDPKVLLGIVQGGYEPRRKNVGEIGWVAPLRGNNCNWFADISNYANLLATNYSDLDGDGITDLKLRLQRVNNGADVKLVASLYDIPVDYTFPGLGTFAPQIVTAGYYFNNEYYAILANRSEIRMYSAATGKLAGTLSTPSGFAGLVGAFTLKLNPDSYDDLVLLDKNWSTYVYTGGLSGLTPNSAARFTALQYDADDVTDYVAAIDGYVYLSESSNFYIPESLEMGNGRDVAAGNFRSDSSGRKDLVLLLSSSVSGPKIELCSYPSGCSPINDTATATGMSVGDVNHDGYDDLVLTNSDGKTVFYLGGGASTNPFTKGTTSDENGDGLDDYTVNGPNNSKTFLVGTSTGPIPAEWIDLNHDDILDIRALRDDGTYAWWTKTSTKVVRDIPREEFAIFGSTWISLNDGTKVYGDAGQLVAVGAFGENPYNKPNGDSISVFLGVQASAGDVWSKNLVSLNNYAIVSGDLWTSQALLTKYPVGYISQDSRTVTVSGKAMAADSSSLTKGLTDVAITFPTPTPGTLHPTGTLAPGKYDAVISDPSKTLTFTAGKYTFNSLKLEANTNVIIDSSAGPVYLLVQNELIVRGTIKDTAGRFDKLFIGYWGTNAVGADLPLAGTLVAPNTQVALNTTMYTHRGAVFAKSVTMHQWNKLEHHKFTGAWPGSAGFSL